MLRMYVGRERRNRVIALVVVGVLLASVILGLLATLASSSASAAPSGSLAAAPAGMPGHASLVSVSPADGSRLDHAPSRVELRFSDPVARDLPKVELSRDGQPVPTAPAVVDGATVTAELGEPGRPGAYRLAWRVVSEDGHPISGESTFTVLAGTTPSATPSGSAPAVVAGPGHPPTPTYKTAQRQVTTFGHPDHRPGLFVAGFLVLCGVALLVIEHRRRAASRLDAN